MIRLIFMLVLLLTFPVSAQVQDGTQIMKIIGIGVPFVLVIGDSLTAGADLPPTVCEFPVVTIGVGGARPSTFITLAEDMTAYKLVPRLIVIALGINNALSGYTTDFRATYLLLLDSLPKAPLVIATPAPIDPTGSDGSRVDLHTMVDVELAIREISEVRHSTLVDLSKLHHFETRDGIHPTDRAKPAWREAIVDGIERGLGCFRSLSVGGSKSAPASP